MLVGILCLAALTRLWGIAERGRWNADQGNEMLVLHELVRNGIVPLLGPPTQIAGTHHGALYYWLMAPAALLSNSDPTAVAIELAILGVGAVAATWWLGRRTGGPLAAAFAALLMAVSPAAIENSTVIWNPSPVPLFAALAAVGTVLAHQDGRARWWLLAAAGTMGAMQCHALAAALVVPVTGAWVLELVRTRREHRPLRPLLLGGLGGIVILAAGYLPLAIHELQTEFSETAAFLGWLGGAGGSTGLGGGTAPGIAVDAGPGTGIALPVRAVVVTLRTLTSPLAGLLTERPFVILVVAAIVVTLAVVAIRAPRPWAARWQAATVAWTVLVLAVAVPATATVTPQLPNDHYHALADPLVIALAATGLAVTWARMRQPASRALVAVALGVFVAAAVTSWPPLPAYDGGFPVADAAAARVETLLQGRSPALVELPPFKTAEGIEFPLVRRGVSINPEMRDASVIVVECDPLFEAVMGAACGGDAERAWQAAEGRTSLRVLDRFAAGPRRWISVYEQDLPALDPAIDPVQESRTPAPVEPAFAVPETRTLSARPGQVPLAVAPHGRPGARAGRTAGRGAA